jgi:hypothetical protein
VTSPVRVRIVSPTTPRKSPMSIKSSSAYTLGLVDIAGEASRRVGFGPG